MTSSRSCTPSPSQKMMQAQPVCVSARSCDRKAPGSCLRALLSLQRGSWRREEPRNTLLNGGTFGRCAVKWAYCFRGQLYLWQHERLLVESLTMHAEWVLRAALWIAASTWRSRWNSSTRSSRHWSYPRQAISTFSSEAAQVTASRSPWRRSPRSSWTTQTGSWSWVWRKTCALY